MALQGSYWQGDCVVPLGQMYWVLAVQVSCLLRATQCLQCNARSCGKLWLHALCMPDPRGDGGLKPPPPLPPIWALQCAAFMALALYLDAVLPDANGVRLPPWFLLSPSYWRLGGGVSCAAGDAGEQL